ncbi:MAG TPA: 4Fe-4S dicluster domain-containing protein [Dehalococcoidales bacterium]|nr:4Fe-4S dicluster domain-containing protein [Dehalococcoidales bacterium]
MVKYGLLVDFDRCQGCNACEVACKQENELPVGPRLKQVLTLGPEKVGRRLIMEYLPVMCMHCENPPCAAACPAGAIVKDEHGITLVNGKKCHDTDKDFCKKACIPACPYPVPPQYNPEKDIVQMCNMCMQRVGRGEEPSCVKHCINKVIKFGPIKELSKIIQERGNRTITIGGVLPNVVCRPSVMYIPAKIPYTLE